MIPLKQTTFGKEGNCFSACLASILELESPQDIPNYVLLTPENFMENYNEWLRPRGLFCLEMKYQYELLLERDRKFWGYHWMVGPASRGLSHSVVGCQGEMVHDPHPDNTGLVGDPFEWVYGFFVERI